MAEYPVTLTHPKTGATRRANSIADVVRFEFDGFVKDAPKADAAEEPTERPAFGPDSDPADYTVAEVQTYLATADDAESARVLTAEAAGKNRTTLVG